MGVVNGLKGMYNKLTGKKKGVDRDIVFEAEPVRNPLIKWEQKETGEIQMEIPLQKSLKLTILTYLFNVPKKRTVVLDAVGTRVWTLCDGETNVRDIINILAEEHNLSKKEIEVSLFSYLQNLVNRGYIGLKLKGQDEDPTFDYHE